MYSRDNLSVFHPLDQKAYEYAIATYVLLTGCLFLFNPSALNAPVYENWHHLGTQYWGLSLIVVAFLHYSALILNGRNLKISQPVRIIAILTHLGVSLTFAKMFLLGGASWGAITYGFFVPIVLIILGRNVMRYYLQENENGYTT